MGLTGDAAIQVNMLEANSQLLRLVNSALANESVEQVRRLLIAQTRVGGLLAMSADARWPDYPVSLQRA